MWRSFIDLVEASDTLKHDIFLNKIGLTQWCERSFRHVVFVLPTISYTDNLR